MELIALAIVFSTVLYLVDKNQKWKPLLHGLWRTTKTLTLAALVATAAYLLYRHFAHSSDPSDTTILIVLLMGAITAFGAWLAEKLGLIASLRAARQSSALVRSSDRSTR